MDEFIKLLDPSLDYISHEIIGDTIFIRVASNREEAVCPYCGHASSKGIALMSAASRIFLSWA